MSDEQTYMIRTEMDRARLFEFGRLRRLPLRDVDLGYLVHCALRTLFGDGAPQPFSFRERDRGIEVLGYSAAPAEELLAYAQTFADPSAWSIVARQGVLAKPMPAIFIAGQRLGFQVRVCPIIRKSNDGPKHRKGAEVDVFLSKCWEVPEGFPIDRQEVYREWLGAQLRGSSAGEIRESRVLSFRRQRVTRSTHAAEPRVRVSERPDALFTGTLEVGDPLAFKSVLRRGIGRHRAFGFGMLLLRPPGTTC